MGLFWVALRAWPSCLPLGQRVKAMGGVCRSALLQLRVVSLLNLLVPRPRELSLLTQAVMRLPNCVRCNSAQQLLQAEWCLLPLT